MVYSFEKCILLAIEENQQCLYDANKKSQRHTLSFTYKEP